MWFFSSGKLVRLLETIAKELVKMNEALVALEAQIRANTEVEASAVLLIQGIAAQLAEAATDPVKVNELAAQLKASADALSAAVAANTRPVA